MIHFISGHLDLTADELAAHYEPRIRAAAEAGHAFVVGDARGADQMAQQILHRIGARATVFHMFAAPRHNEGAFPTRGGFTSDADRDAALTAASDADIAWVRPGREKSGTAKNLKRRAELARDDTG